MMEAEYILRCHIEGTENFASRALMNDTYQRKRTLRELVSRVKIDRYLYNFDPTFLSE